MRQAGFLKFMANGFLGQLGEIAMSHVEEAYDPEPEHVTQQTIRHVALEKITNHKNATNFLAPKDHVVPL